MNAEFKHRMPDVLHARVKALAKEYGTSVTGLINTTMKELVASGSITDLEKRVSELEKEVNELKGKQ